MECSVYRMKKLITLFVFLLSIQSLYAQLNFLPKFIRKMYVNADTNRKPSFLILPAISSSPETGLEFGGAWGKALVMIKNFVLAGVAVLAAILFDHHARLQDERRCRFVRARR